MGLYTGRLIARLLKGDLTLCEKYVEGCQFTLSQDLEIKERNFVFEERIPPTVKAKKVKKCNTIAQPLEPITEL